MPQKIDSQEFEVANPARYPDATEIVVRVWAPGRSDRGASLSWRSDSVLIYMIADLVGASHGRIAEESSALMSAQFDSSQQAILAAKRIQTSVLEFLACRPGERVAAAILIHPASEPVALNTETIRQTLRQAKPGQILLADDTSKRLRDVPGIELSAVPKLTTVMGERRTEVTELVWTTPDRVALLQNSIADEVEPASDDAPLVGATVIVSPFGRGGQTNAAAPPVVGAGGVSKNSLATASRQVSPDSNRAQQRPPALEDLRESPGSFGDGFNELAQRPFLTGTRIILGVTAIVLVAALIALVYHPTQVSKRPIPLQQDQTGAAESAADKQPPARIEPAKTEPEAVTPPTESTVKTEIAKPQNVKPSNPKSKGKAAVVALPQISDKPPAENRVKLQETPALFTDELGGVSQKEIPTLLKMAQADAGAGNYDKARIEFRKILGLQPGNQDAKEGLHKLDLIQK